MKDAYKLIKELLKNKRYRALIILGLYLVFMSFVVMSIRTAPTNETKVDNRLEEFKLKTNYNYTYTIKTTKDEIVETKTILGTRYNNKNQLIYEDKTYLFDNVLIGFPINEIDLSKLTYDYIYSYIKESTNINDIYTLKLSNFMKIVNGVNITSENNILINILFTNNIVNQIEIDLTKYVNFNQELYDQYIVTINYSNIGNVVDF